MYLQISKISTMAYKEEYPYHYNNFLYKVQLSTPASSSTFPGTQPGTVKAPQNGVSVLVVKLSNSLANVNPTNRVENDVATQYLARENMILSGLGPLVAAVYAWAPTP